MKTRIALLAGLLSIVTPVAANDGRELLEDFFDNLDTLRADFEQVVTGVNGQVQDIAAGQVYLCLPDQFRWDYVKPFEQLILADGENVWVYDVMLQQVTVRDQEAAAARSPMMTLADIDTLDEHFQVEELGQKGEWYWLRMYPTDERANFESMDVAVGEDGLRQMVFTDRFGQETRISFFDLETDVELDDELFEFTPPDEADVIGEP